MPPSHFLKIHLNIIRVCCIVQQLYNPNTHTHTHTHTHTVRCTHLTSLFWDVTRCTFRLLPIFRDKVLVPSSRVKQSKKTNYQPTPCNIPEEQGHRLPYGGCLNSPVFVSLFRSSYYLSLRHSFSDLSNDSHSWHQRFFAYASLTPILDLNHTLKARNRQ